MKTKHANISVFVPHLGCPNMCSFCNQRYIAGTAEVPSADTVDKAVAASTVGTDYDSDNTEIAFFGGSFTAIDRTLMCELLSAAYKYVKNGTVKGIRISTRPDAIDEDVLSVLSAYGVTSIELGAQSMNDSVLQINKRGHTADDVINASKLIKSYGFELGLQMMTGLYGSDDAADINTAYEFVKLSPDTVRIYPTIVLDSTDLAELCKSGKYKPQTVLNAVPLCSKLMKIFYDNRIKVIRLGLHNIDTEHYVAGPWHPAFSELVFARMYLEAAKEKLIKLPKGNYRLTVKKGCISKMVGQKKENINTLRSLGYECRVYEDDNLCDYEIKTEGM